MILAGIRNMNVPALIRSARSRVILHAAVYAPFAASARHCAAIREYLGRPGTNGMDVITLPRTVEPWSQRFLHILRDRATEAEARRELSDSWRFLDELREGCPARLRIHELEEAPCFPALIVDDTILFGQYANASIPAPLGIWVRLQADVERLMGWSITGVPENASEFDVAAYRVVEDCVRAMQSGENREHPK
ncbi:hypothetical protein [Salidesulfovibrio brasiliensis]|uniref:hypothetical protein n=1 Tax=Salidesulfovibrio brasiliensis TaxID=221711 RepID=UPI0006D085D9|nr:hypothetical protein [Salidesulfovibrio brasiliensis]